MKLNRYLSVEVLFIHLGHGALFIAATALVASNTPWWSWFIAAPITVFAIFGWIYEAKLVMPAATRLWRGDAGQISRKRRPK